MVHTYITTFNMYTAVGQWTTSKTPDISRWNVTWLRRCNYRKAFE